MKSDFHYAGRMLMKSPGFAIVAILTLALGIGANTAVFSIIDGVLLRRLPYADADRLVLVLDRSMHDPQLTKLFASHADYKEYLAHSSSFERFAGLSWAQGGAILTGHGRARGVVANLVTGDFFAMLGATPALGRTFSGDELRGGCWVVLSNAFWHGTLGGDPRVVGQSLTLSDRACTVVGVMPAAFEVYPRQTEIWMLLTPDYPGLSDHQSLVGVGRLKRGVSLAQAQAELARLHRAIHPGDAERDLTPELGSLQDLFLFLAGRNLRPTLWILLAAVGAVLLIACANIASLMLGRLASRERELAVRAALGSGRWRMVRQLLAEGLLVAASGGALGVWAGFGALEYFKHANPIELPIGAHIALNLPVLGFTALLSIATALMFALAPALTISLKDVNLALRATGRGAAQGAGAAARWLIACEIALSVVLLASGAMLIESVLNMGAAPLGFDPAHLLRMNVMLPKDRYAAPDRMTGFWDELRRRVNALAGVEGAAVATNPPPYGTGFSRLDVEGRPRSDAQDTGENMVSSEYFRVLKIGVRRGRVFDHHDRAGTEPVCVINQSLAREYFGDRDPIGAHVRIFGFDEKENAWATVVGVVGDEKRPELMHEMSWHAQPVLYRPIAQSPATGATLLVRSSSLEGLPLEEIVSAIDANVPSGEVMTMEAELGSFLQYPRFRAIVIGAFAVLALLLAAVGLYGLVAQFVANRTREIGIRMAIGARPANVLWLIGRQAGAPVLAGLAAGLVSTAALARYFQALLYGVRGSDPRLLATVSLTLAMVAMLALMFPAARAVRVDPVATLRNE